MRLPACIPNLLKYAEEENEKRALTSFTWAYEVEKVHEVLYKEALELLKKRDHQWRGIRLLCLPGVRVYPCPLCTGKMSGLQYTSRPF